MYTPVYIPSSRDKFMVEMSWAGPWAGPWVDPWATVGRPMGRLMGHREPAHGRLMSHLKTSSCFCLKFNLCSIHWFLQTFSVNCFVYRVMSHLKEWVTHVFQYHKPAHEPPWVGLWIKLKVFPAIVYEFDQSSNMCGISHSSKLICKLLCSSSHMSSQEFRHARYVFSFHSN